MEVLAIVPLAETTLNEFRMALSQRSDLQSVKDAIMPGQPKKSKTTEGVKLFWAVHDELVVYENLPFRGEHLVIPKT